MVQPAQLLDAYREATQCHLRAALATVVRVVGSAYRRPGARMLIFSDGRTFGSISGGCLENDVAVRSQTIIDQGVSAVLQYSTMGSDDDIIFGLGVGCNGSVEILVEPLAIPESLATLKLLDAHLELRRPLVLGTIFGGSGSDEPRLGRIVVFHGGGAEVSQGLTTSFTEEVLSVAKRVYDLGCSETVSINDRSSQYDLFFEFVEPPIKVIVCGAGSDAIPVSMIAKQIGWHVEVIDHRPEYALSTRFPVADKVVRGGAEEIERDINGCVRTAILIMTHNYSRDLEYLRRSIVSDVEYIGLLGPKQRTQRLLQELKTEGVVYSSEQFARLHAPVGLDIGAESEQEIALSVVSEVQAAMSSRRGGFLRDKNGPIHSDTSSAEIAENIADRDHSRWSTVQCPLE
ncbi:MAG TPA: XdhC family protein [Trichormus sp.]